MATINLAWTDNSSDETGFTIERCMGAACSGFAFLHTTAASATSYSDTTCLASTIYRYRVFAFNGAGDSDYSDTAEALTLPDAPSLLIATSGPAQNSLVWAASFGAFAYQLYSGLSSGAYDPTPIYAGSATSFVDTGLANDVTVYYVVTATNVSGESGLSDEASATPVLDPPSLLLATAGSSQNSLAWAASDGADSYTLYSSLVSGSGYAPIYSGSATSFIDAGLTNDVIVYYVVTASNTGGESALSEEASAMPVQAWWKLPLAAPYDYSIPADAQPTAYTNPVDWVIGGVFYPAGTSFPWVVMANPPNDKGWWLTVDTPYNGAAYIVENSRPKDPRAFLEMDPFAVSSAGMLGGFPGPSCVWENHLLYAEGAYTVGTTPPKIRIFDGAFDREVISLPSTTAGAVPRAIVSMLVAEGVIYLSTFDTGTNSTNWAGRVFSLDIETGTLTPMGAATTFASGHLPYALAWHMGRLWCGTNKGNGTASKIYYIRPGIDTTWTADYDLGTSTQGGVASLLSYKGQLYVGCTEAAGTFAKVLVRSTLGVYTDSNTGSGGTASLNNGFLAMTEFAGNLYASFWNPDSTAISEIRKFNNTSWTTPFQGATVTLVPFVGFPTDSATLLAIGGGLSYSGVLLSTTDGTTWVDHSAYLSQGTTLATGLPVFGVVMR